ncbi:MAG: hypothetical protein HKN32_04175 [Flavobacteriales bacterium]|nr:hypothetical protein [Flavobacteriales bacterium]
MTTDMALKAYSAVLTILLLSLATSAQDLVANFSHTRSEANKEVCSPCLMMDEDIAVASELLFANRDFEDAIQHLECLETISVEHKMLTHAAKFLQDPHNSTSRIHSCFTFDASDGIPYVPEEGTIRWTFPDGDIIDGVKGSKCFARPGIYHVQFEIDVPSPQDPIHWDTTLTVEVSRPFESAIRKIEAVRDEPLQLNYHPPTRDRLLWVIEDGRYGFGKEFEVLPFEPTTGYKLFKYDPKYDEFKVIEMGQIITEEL